MSEQPEALRLADALEQKWWRWKDNLTDELKAAAELRRLHEVETKYHESVGGFKRDLAEKLEQQRKKNIRLTDELRRLEKDYVARDAELRRLHEVNAELLEFVQEVRRTGDTRLASMAIAAIAKATRGEA